ncbi:UNVERIFIED_CONTAM: hypothetical protein K2H54_024220 [Gekko kuhli]
MRFEPSLVVLVSRYFHNHSLNFSIVSVRMAVNESIANETDLMGVEWRWRPWGRLNENLVTFISALLKVSWFSGCKLRLERTATIHV